MRWAGFHGRRLLRLCLRPSPCGRWMTAFACAIGLLCVSHTAHARSYGGPWKEVRFLEDRGGLYVFGFDFQSFFDRKLKSHLQSGFQKVLQLTVRVYRVKPRRHIKTVVRKYLVTYQLMHGSYRIVVLDSTGRLRKHIENKLGGALGRIARVEQSSRIYLGPAKSFARGVRFFVDVTIQFAPLPRSVLRKIQNWLKHPAGPSPGLLRGGSPLGRRFAIVINSRISRALKSMTFQTQQFWVP